MLRQQNLGGTGIDDLFIVERVVGQAARPARILSPAFGFRRP